LQAKIIENYKAGTDYFVMTMQVPHIDDSWTPGRFLHLKISQDNAYDPLLRRPLSLFDVNREEKLVSLLYCVVGRGTELLSRYQKGESIDFLGPLGQGFTLQENKKILIIGGGMGTAPLYYLCRKLSGKNKVMVLLGGNICSDIAFFEKKFSQLDVELQLSTMDGSSGSKGTVIDLWKEKISFQPSFIYTCGPRPMLKVVSTMIEKHNLQGEVSLEERMGCAVGVCLSCVCKTDQGNQRVCKEGPVFDIKEVIFDE